MRIRLTLDIQRHKDTPPKPEPPEGLEFAQAATERAEPTRIGFRIDGPSTEEDA